MQEARQEIIKQFASDFFQKMGFPVSVDVAVERTPEETFLCLARVEQDQNLLIGQYGTNLAAIQHLIRVLLCKKIGGRVNVIVDINGYFSDKRAALEREADSAAQEALRDSISVALRPMLPYERKIVHSFLAKNPQIITESVGKGDERKIMVRPKLEGGPSEAA